MLGQHRSTQRRVPAGPDDEERLTADLVELARRHGRLGYRKIAEMLRSIQPAVERNISAIFR